MISGSVLTHAEKTHPVWTRLLSFGKNAELLRMSEIADTGSRCSMVRSMVPKILRFPQSLRVAMLVHLILKMLATITSARISSRVVFHSSSLAVCNFADSSAMENQVWLVFTVCIASFVVCPSSFFYIGFLERVTARNPRGMYKKGFVHDLTLPIPSVKKVNWTRKRCQKKRCPCQTTQRNRRSE